MLSATIPVIGFSAYSGSGKTTLLKQLIPWLRQQGLSVGVIKLSHHRIDVDKPGKDSYELRKAGASEMLLTSRYGWALMADTEGTGDPDLQAMLDKLDQSRLNLILVEGFRHRAFPKIELHRPVLGKPLIFPDDPSVIAVASDVAIAVTTELPQLDLNDVPSIGRFIVDWMGKTPA